jgi:hypothetical protein
MNKAKEESQVHQCSSSIEITKIHETERNFLIILSCESRNRARNSFCVLSGSTPGISFSSYSSHSIYWSYTW